jgi:uncharacterized protein (TIGR02246 family)
MDRPWPHALVGISSIALIFAGTSNAQTRPPWIQDHFENLDFAAGTLGRMPPGWHLGPEGTPAYTARTDADAACHVGRRCGVVRSTAGASNGRCFLYQTVDATPYRGRWLSYRAAVRADLTARSVARLLVRVHRQDNSTSFYDDMGDHPIKSGPWAFYEIDALIFPDARDIEFGLQVYGEGSAAIDNISMDSDFVGHKANEEAVRALFRKFADARNAHDGPAAAALYSEDGEWSNEFRGGTLRGRESLATMWSGVTDQVERTVDSVDFPLPTVAIVRATLRPPDHSGEFHETLVLIREQGVWHIRAHQAHP